MTRWIRGPELDPPRDRAPFDPVGEGVRYHLSRELSLALWDRARADATDTAGRCDLAQAQQRFHELAARGGHLRPDIGKITRVGTEGDDALHQTAYHHELAVPGPGRQTLVATEPQHVQPLRGAIGAPGRLSLVTAEADRGSAIRTQPGAAAERTTPAPPRPSPRGSRLDEFLALGFREVLQAALASGRQPSHQPTPIADRAGKHADLRVMSAPWLHGGPGAQALWHAAERRGATLYRRAVDAGEVEHDGPAVAAALQRCGAGQPLPDAVRRTMETWLGVRLDRVRIHTDRVAAEAARAVNAEAFTVGEDIFFADGAYVPDTAAGQRLLAHELTHVVQSWQGRTRSDGKLSQPGDPLEREADATADRVVHASRRAGLAAAAGTPVSGLVAPIAPAPAPVAPASSQPVLRKAAAPRASQPTIRGGAGKAPNKAERDMRTTSTDFTHRAGAAGDLAAGKLKHALDHDKASPPGKRAHDHARRHHQDARAHAAQARHLEDQAHARGNADAQHQPEGAAPAAAKAPSGTDPRSPIQLKPISDWSKFMPAPLPDQDERERKRIEGLVQHRIEGERGQAQHAFEQLRTAHLQQARDVRALEPRLTGQVAAAQTAALGKVASAESSQAGAVAAHIAAVQGQVRSHAAAMKSRVSDAHAAAVSRINATHQAADQQLTENKTKALAEVDAAEQLAVLVLQLDFLIVQGRFTAVGARKAGDAITVGEEEAGKLGGQYHGDKLEAAQKAARDTADGFATSMPEQAANSYSELAKSQHDAETSLHDFARTTRDNINKTYDAGKQSIDQVHSQSIQGADAAKTGAIAQIDAACSSTVAAIAAQGAAQIAAIHGQARGARTGILQAGAAARASVAHACEQAASGIEGGIAGLISGAKQLEAPDPEQTRAQVQQGAASLARGASGAGKGLASTAVKAGDSLTEQASAAAAGMAQIARAANAAATQLGAGARQQMSAVAGGASQSLAQIATTHKESTDRTMKSADAGFTAQVKALDDSYKDASKQRQLEFDKNVKACEGNLDKTVPPRGGGGGGAGSGKKDDGGGKDGGGGPSDEVGAIQAAAKKAADAVKPWWQKALAIVVSIVVAVVVVLVVTALIATSGPVGVILVGALAGALASVASQMASNLVLGNGVMDGITWKTVAMGAVSGAIGAGLTSAIGAGAEALAGEGATLVSRGATATVKALGEDGAKTLAGYTIKTTIGVGTDFVSDQATNLIFDHKLNISVENIVLSLVTNAASSHQKFENFQEHIQTGIKKFTPFSVKVPGLQISLGHPRAPADVHAPAEADTGGSGHAPDIRGGAPPGSTGAGGKSQPHPTGDRGGAPPRITGDAGGSPARPAGDHGNPTPHPTGDGGRTSTRAPGDDATSGHPANDTSGHGDPKPPARDGKPPGDDGKPPARDGKQSTDDGKSPARDGKQSTDDGKSTSEDGTRPGDDGKPPGQDPARPGDGKPPVADGKQPGGDGKQPHDAPAHPGDPAAPHGEPHGGGAQGSESGGDVPAGDATAAAHDAELGELGYSAGTRAKGEQLANRIESGDVPPKDTVRDTAANQDGLRELAKIHDDPKLTPEQKARLRQDLAARLRGQPEPTGKLPRDIQDARAHQDKAGSEDGGGGGGLDRETGASGGIVDDPRSTYRGDAAARNNSKNVEAGLAEALPALGSHFPPGKVRVLGHDRIEIDVNGAPHEIEIKLVDPDQLHRTTDVANYDLATTPPTIKLSNRTYKKHVERALNHEVAEVNSVLESRASGTSRSARDALAEDSPSQTLSHDDIGRIAELKVLLEDMKTPGKPRDATTDELKALARKLGLLNTDGTGLNTGGLGTQRRGQIEAEGVRIDELSDALGVPRPTGHKPGNSDTRLRGEHADPDGLPRRDVTYDEVDRMLPDGLVDALGKFGLSRESIVDYMVANHNVRSNQRYVHDLEGLARQYARHGLTKQDVMALDLYTSKLFYKELNSRLRESRDVDSVEDLRRVLNDALGKLPKVAGAELYRSMNLKGMKLDSFLADVRSGRLVWDSFSSVADEVAGTFPGDNVLIRIRNGDAFDISDFADGLHYKNPKNTGRELLMQGGIELRVTGLREETLPDGTIQYHVDLEQEHPPAAPAATTPGSPPPHTGPHTVDDLITEHGIHPDHADALRAAHAADPDGTARWLDGLKDSDGLADLLLQHLGPDAPSKVGIDGDLVKIAGELDISIGKLDSLSPTDRAALVKLATQGGTEDEFQYFESTSTKGSKPGARLRFKSRVDARAKEVSDQLLADLGIPDGDPRVAVLQHPGDDAMRLWDLKAEKPFSAKDGGPLRKAAAEWALAQNPASAREFVAYFQFYTAEVGHQATAIHGENAPKDSKREATHQVLDNLGRDSASVSDAWQHNVDVQTGRYAPGTVSLGARTDHDLPGDLSAAADQLAFSNPHDGAYHAHKHREELDPIPTAEDEMAAYLDQARHIVATEPGVVRHNQDGSRSVTYSQGALRAIIFVSRSGEASLATFGTGT